MRRMYCNKLYQKNYYKKLFAGYQLAPCDLISFDGFVSQDTKPLILKAYQSSLKSFKNCTSFDFNFKIDCSLIYDGAGLSRIFVKHSLYHNPSKWIVTDDFIKYLANRNTWRYVTRDHRFDEEITKLVMERKICNHGNLLQ